MTGSLLIKGGRLFDAERSMFSKNDILINGDSIKDISPDIAAECPVIDALGLVVSPGFIDCHGHSDENPLFDCDGGSKLHDGVTTEICGNCGSSLFPGKTSLGARKRICPFSGTPYSIGHNTLGSYLDSLDKKGMPLNMGFLVGHGSLRDQAAGRENRTCTREERQQMLEKFHDFLDQGAMGLSLGFAYPPGCYADTGEVMPLAAAAAERDVIITSHIRNEGNTLFESVEEFIALAEREACRIQISHIKAMWKHNWDKAQAIAEYIQKKRENGIDVTADRYPYTAASTGLDHLLPDSFYEGGDEKEYARLEDPALLKKAEKKIYSLYGPDIFDYVQVVGVPGIHNENEYAGRRISAIAQDMGRSPFEIYIHLIRAGKLRGAAVYYGMSEHNLELFLSQTFVGVGSDARYRSVEGISSSGTVHPRAYGTFSRFLGRYVREKGLLTLEEALRRITAFPAERFNINKRGYLKKGYRADITIFDPEKIRDTATFENPHRYSQGVEYVILNGTVAKKRTELVSHTAGRVVRG